MGRENRKWWTLLTRPRVLIPVAIVAGVVTARLLHGAPLPMLEFVGAVSVLAAGIGLSIERQRLGDPRRDRDSHVWLIDRLKSQGDRTSASRVRDLKRQHRRMTKKLRKALKRLGPDIAERAAALHDAALHAYRRGAEMTPVIDDIDTPAIRDRLSQRRAALLVDADDAVTRLTATLDHAAAAGVERGGPAGDALREARAALDEGLAVARHIDERIAAFEESLQDPTARRPDV